MFSNLDKYCLIFIAFTLELCDFSQDAYGGNKVINIGVILPVEGRYAWGMNKTAPAIQFAVESVEKSNDILPGYKFNLMYGDSQCSETFGPLQAIDMYYKRSVNLFLGPVCDFSVSYVASFSPHWNVPVITAGALVGHFEDKSQYKLLTRMSGSYDKLGEFFIEVFKEFDWVTPAVIYHDLPSSGGRRSMCYFTMKSVHYALKQHYIQHYPNGKIWNEAFDERYLENYDFGAMLRKASNHARIMVLCGSDDSIREIMISAAELGFDNGEYVFFNIDLFPSEKQNILPWKRDDDTPERNEKARRGYEALMTVTIHKPDSEEYNRFSEEVKRRANEQYGNNTYGEEKVNSFVEAFHDAVIVYASALNKTLALGYGTINGSEIMGNMWNRTFQGITGIVSIDDNGDRNMDYSLLDLNPHLGKFEIIANYYGNKKKYEAVENKKVHWPGGREGPPPDMPDCDFDGSLCPPDKPFPQYALAIILLSSLLPIVTISAFFMHRRRAMQWKQAQVAKLIVDWNEISFGMENKKSGRYGSRLSIFADHLGDLGNKQVFIKTGNYKNVIVAIKEFKKPHIHPNSTHLLQDFTEMIDIHNNHLVRFMGACLDPPNQCILTEYCSRGSLQDVLENEKMKLDSVFKSSLIQDIITGMAYLHSSVIRSHGNLKSSNCVVDSHFQLKITDFGLQSLRNHNVFDEESPHLYYQNKLWTAPELLRMHDPPIEGTQKGDAYSFAIICQEIIFRKGTFWVNNEELTSKEICQKVKAHETPYFRPILDWKLKLADDANNTKGGMTNNNQDAMDGKSDNYSANPWVIQDGFNEKAIEKAKETQDDVIQNAKENMVCEAPNSKEKHVANNEKATDESDADPPEVLLNMVKQCWDEDPSGRPDFQSLERTIHTINEKGDKGNILENLRVRMELYAEDLENQVEARTADYVKQTKEVERVLHLLLPKSVAEQLMKGKEVAAESFDSVSIYFSDIKGFTALCSQLNPEEVVELLRALYKAFDSIADKLDVYKVETIGDAYMVTSGLPVKNGIKHAGEICRMALGILNAVQCFKIKFKPDHKLQIRIGIHTGPVLAGVVGHKMPRYCLFGGTVLTASAMESSGEAMKIQISPTTKELLDRIGSFEVERRDLSAVEAKDGELYQFKSRGTFWLLGERESDQSETLAPESVSAENDRPSGKTHGAKEVDKTDHVALRRATDKVKLFDTL